MSTEKPEKSKPSVRDVPLSKDRIKEFRKEVIHGVGQGTIRKVISYTTIENVKRPPKVEFVKFGVNHILDKIWFVEGVYDKTVWSAQGLGLSYGQGLAESETKYVLKELEKIEDRIIKINATGVGNAILSATTRLHERHMRPNAILTGVNAELDLWSQPEFRLVGNRSKIELGIPASLSGVGTDVPIFWAREVPKGTAFVIDNKEFGEVIVKEGPRVEISEVRTAQDQEEVKKAIPSIPLSEISEKVRLLVYEIIYLDIQNPKAVSVARF